MKLLLVIIKIWDLFQYLTGNRCRKRRQKMFIFLIRRGLSSNSKLYTFRVSFLMSQKCRRPTDLQKHEKFNIVHVSIPSYMTPLGCAKIPRFSSFTSFSHHRKYQRLTKSREVTWPRCINLELKKNGVPAETRKCAISYFAISIRKISIA